MPVREYENNAGFYVRREFSSAGPYSAEEAERLDSLCHAAFQRVREQFALGLSSCPSILESLDDFLSDPTYFNGRDPKTLHAYRTTLTNIARSLSRGAGDIAVDRITQVDLLAWISDRLSQKGHRGKYVELEGLAAETVNKDLQRLRFFVRWCRSRNYCSLDIDVMTVSNVPTPERNQKANRYAPRSLSPAEFMGLLSDLREGAYRVWLVLRGMLLLGLRPRALFLLNATDATLPTRKGDGMIRQPALKGGIRTLRMVKRGTLLAEWVEQCHVYARWVYAAQGSRFTRRKSILPNLHGNRWSTASFDRALAAAVKRVGFGRRFTAYMARHSAVTWLKAAGVHPTAVQHYAKHLSITTQGIYDWTGALEAAPAYDVMDALLGAGKRIPEKSGALSEQEVYETLDSALSSCA